MRGGDVSEYLDTAAGRGRLVGAVAAPVDLGRVLALAAEQMIGIGGRGVDHVAGLPVQSNALGDNARAGAGERRGGRAG